MKTYSSNVVFDKQVLRNKVKQYLDQPGFALDIETMGGEHRGTPQVNHTVWLSFATFGDAFVLPIGHPNGNRIIEPARRRKDRETNKFVITPPVWEDPPDQIRPGDAFEILYDLFYNPDIEKVGQGFSFDVLSLAKYFDNEYMPGPYHDTLIQHWLINENKKYGLKDVTKARYRRDYDKEHVGRCVEKYGFNKVATYAFMDAKFTWLHHNRNMPMLEAEGLLPIYEKEMSTFKVLLDVGMEGTLVDKERMEALEKDLADKRTEYVSQVYKNLGRKFNLNSNPQKVAVFYGDKKDGNLGLRPWKLTKGGLKRKDLGQEIRLQDYSTDKESLEGYTDHPVVGAFVNYQEVDRVLGTYIHGYLGWTPPPGSDKKSKPCIIFDNKVYPEFVQYGTVTGRFSCRTPNLQNIPRPDTDLGKEVRSLFIAGEGHKLVVADYGQVELVVLAHFVGRGALYDGFYQGIDPHTMTAAMVFGYDPVELTRLIKEVEDPEAKKYRQIAKNLNFAIVYGAGPAKVAAMSKVTERKARGFLREHERQFPEVYKFKDDVLKTARSRKPPHVVTLLGRKRRVPTIMSSDMKSRGRGERQLINSLIQGSAADLIKEAMIRLHGSLGDQGKLVLTVHDELVVRCPEENAPRVEQIMTEAMTGAGIQSLVDVPLNIDLHSVDRWADAK